MRGGVAAVPTNFLGKEIFFRLLPLKDLSALFSSRLILAGQLLVAQPMTENRK